MRGGGRYVRLFLAFARFNLATELSYRAAHKVAYIVTSFLPYAGLFVVCQLAGGYFDGLPGPATLAAYVASLLMAFLIGFFFETCLGMVGFWFLEVSSLL